MFVVRSRDLGSAFFWKHFVNLTGKDANWTDVLRRKKYHPGFRILLINQEFCLSNEEEENHLPGLSSAAGGEIRDGT